MVLYVPGPFSVPRDRSLCGICKGFRVHSGHCAVWPCPGLADIKVGQALLCLSFCVFQRRWLELAQHWWSWVVLASPLPAFLQKLLDHIRAGPEF